MQKITKNPMYRFLIILTIASSVGLQGWRTLFNNFAVEESLLTGFQIGIIQSIREVPGFLSLLVIYLLFFIKEYRLSSISVILLSIGILLTGFFPSFTGLIVTTFLFSLGFHYFETTNQSLTLQYFSYNDAAYVLGKQKSYYSLANIVIGIIIWSISYFLEIQNIYILIALIVGLLGCYSFFGNPVDKDLPIQHKKMIIKKKYWLFYTLNFLAGARRQIFMVFAVLLLVEKYQFSIKMITFLFVLNNMINFFIAPMIAKWITHFGERRILTLEYISLIFIFLAYAFISNPIIASVLYILDHIFFNCAMAIKTYFQKTADRCDIAPSMAVSFTINHITAVFLPFIGGMLWMINDKIPFILGAGLSFISLFFVQKIKVSSHIIKRSIT